VSTAIQGLISAGVAPSDIAVLFRVNAQSEAYEQALASAGVPYVVRGLERFFDRAEVKQATTLLRGAARAERDGTDETTDRISSELGDQVRAVLTATGWSAEPPPGSGAVRTRWESLAALVALADQLVATDPSAGLPDLVAELEARASVQHVPTPDGVTLTTLHAAKGLEWDAVFLVGLADGTVPLTHAVGEDQIEEERRLLYVGATRARRILSLSWARSRSPGGRANRRPSRFLDGVRPRDMPDERAPGQPTSRSRKRAEVAQCRVCGRGLSSGAERKIGRCETCPATYDEDLLDRLRTWRSARAREQALPAYCVFTDATLVAVAEAVPTSSVELGRISGIGAAKLASYGAEVLELCAKAKTA
jgi:DNA helicase-2/ATP-dependent DNA helicase PcrA